MLEAITLDFIEYLKCNKCTKNWIISPLLTHPNYGVGHGGILLFKPLSPNISPTEAYLQEQSHRNITFVKIKVPDRPLRLISLSFTHPGGKPTNSTKPLVYLSFWRANGWIQNKKTLHKRYVCVIEVPDNYHAFLVYRIYRISKTSKKKPTIIHYDSYDVSDPEMCQKTVDVAVAIINQSFGWRGRKNEKFKRYEPFFMINLDGENYEASPWQIR